MKKLLALVLALMMVLTLVACGTTPPSGGGTTPPSGGGTTPPSGGGTSDPPSGGNDADLTTVDGWLTYWGLTENDLKCANYTRLDKTAFNKETLVISTVGAYCSKRLTEDEIRAWLGQILDKLNAMAEEGKVVNTLDNNAEITVDYIIEHGKSYLYMVSGHFTYNGKDTSAFITVTPGDLDNADPDLASAACTLELEH